MNKIIIFGFPHCGTTILRSIIGHIDDVYEELDESKIITGIQTSKKFTLCKWPHLINLNDNIYNEYIKIFIIRNPLYVFSSLNKRFHEFYMKGEEIEKIEKYIETIKKFYYYKNNPTPNLYVIKYEDLFNNNYQNIKEIFNHIGFEYTDKIFDNSQYKNISHKDIDSILQKEPRKNVKEHVKYRNWQINQPFVYNDTIDKINLTNKQKEQILNSKEILAVYPEIKTILETLECK